MAFKRDPSRDNCAAKSDHFRWSCEKCTFENDAAQSKCEICEWDRNGETSQGQGQDNELARLLRMEENIKMQKLDEMFVKAMVGEEGMDHYFGLPNIKGEELLDALHYPLDKKENKVAVFYSAELFENWVEQSSYSCGATSVANVINALQRKAKISTKDVLKFYIDQNSRHLRTLILKIEKANKKIKIQKLFNYLEKECFDGDCDGYYGCNKSELSCYAKMWLEDQDIDAKKPSILKKLREILRVKKGIVKLKWKKNSGPHTSVVGSAALRRACEKVAAKCANVNVVATSIVNNSKAEKRAWERIKLNLKSSTKQLIFHLTNHYAPIYAAREFIGTGNKRSRQILTAYDGQAPSAWLDWDTEVLQIIDRWAGYNIMEFELVENGKPRMLPKHAHPMKLNDRQTRWVCDGCHSDSSELPCGKRYRCKSGCDFDYCDVCYKTAAADST